MSTGDRRAQRALREDVRAAKESLSRHPQTDLPLPEPFDDVLVTRVELEALIRPGMLRSVELLAATIRSTGMTPDRLVGIYLVGGSSRIPLVGKLIAELLRVVPSSLDQPETAVALGAHHVSREGVLVGTANLAAQVPAAAPPRPPVVPQPVLMPPGPAPMQPAPAPVLRPPVVPQGFPVAPGYPRRRSPLPWLIGVGAAVAAGVVVLVIALSGSDGGGGGSPGGGGGSATGAGACSDKSTRDGQGYTPCLKEFIGSVASRADCESSSV